MDEPTTATSPAPATAPAGPTVRPRAMGADLAARPEATWLDEVEREIDDVDVVLKCLSQADVCATCQALQAQGRLEARPVLSRCAGSKQPG